MDFITRLQRLKIKLLNWEYWNMYLIYFPINLIWFFYAFKAKKLFFFTGINPGMYTSGFFGASKYKVLSKIPDAYKPKTTIIQRNKLSYDKALEQINQSHTLPYIVKPDVGERGLMVNKIYSEDQLESYYAKNNFDFIVQEFSTLSQEFSILCFKDPESQEYIISSLCKKEFLTVTGDGTSDLKMLITAKPRALLQLDRIDKENQIDLSSVPRLNEEILLEPIGNHSRGTKFLDYNHHITPELVKVFGKILSKMDQIEYGRFDIKTSNLQDLEKGLNIHILEFNGTASEPSHCYDPKNSLINFYRSMNYHWDKMHLIFKANAGERSTAMSPKEYFSAYKSYRKLTASYCH